MKEDLGNLDDRPEHAPIVQQHVEDLLSYKDDLRSLNEDLLKLGLEDDHELVDLHTALKKLHFECSCTAKGLSSQHTETKTGSSSKITAKLPKLEVPTFNGEILRWRTFWHVWSQRSQAERHEQSRETALSQASGQQWTCRSGHWGTLSYWGSIRGSHHLPQEEIWPAKSNSWSIHQGDSGISKDER